ncbi:MAG TPA: hypothetical protein PK191_05370 [Niabella sp.]|nr:hypothetical protein [Niabella sp.]HOZ97527.1 hypothetical protein [Niabella sp.]HQW15615.1 hypothetical protein [Niabella sp.]HQX20758.1 hypothetical protein [Niabella sp.]HQX41357.1 hypothetical protein [Niabella sp.]
MQRIIGVVITYQPEESIFENIKSYLSLVDKLIVFDNSEPAATINISNDKVIVYADGINKGISERLNDAAKIARTLGADWLLTMDQDSSFSGDNLDAYKNAFELFADKDRTAMIGVRYGNMPEVPGEMIADTDLLITSGCLVNLKIMDELGGFDEALFIDDVDSEYCLKANLNGYRTVLFKHIFLNHSLGTVTLHRSLKSLKKTFRALHSPIRIYYMVRNYFYLAKKYKKSMPASFPIRERSLLNRLKNNLLYNKERLKVVQNVILAWSHFKKGKMGRL